MRSSSVQNYDRQSTLDEAAAKPLLGGQRSVFTDLIQRIESILLWYRRAVTAPETSEEQAEWQQTSF